MEFINALTKIRTIHGFYAKDYSRYILHIRSKRKEPNFISEYFLTRYYLFKTNKRLSNKYIKKAFKHSRDSEIYSKYISGIYYSSTDQDRSIEDFKRARSLASTNFVFVKEIDEKIEALCLQAPEKLQTDWHGLKLEFVNEQEKESFENLKKLENSDYQTVIKNHIVSFRKFEDELKRLTTKNVSGFRNIYEKCKKLNESIISFHKYLIDNFVDNAFIESLEKESADVFLFYENIFKFKNCDLSVEAKIDEFKVSKNFEYLKDAIDYAKKNKVISLRKARDLITKEIEGAFPIEENTIKTPFLPVYYDLAYDYVEYPKEDDGKVNKLLRGLSFFNK